MEGNEIVNDDRKIAIIIYRYFTNITKHLNLKANKINHREELGNIGLSFFFFFFFFSIHYFTSIQISYL